MTTSPITAHEPAAHEHIRLLARACKRHGVTVRVIEPSTRLRVHVPGASPRMAEIITLKPGTDDRLYWYWSWNEPICPASDLTTAVEMIRRVCAP